MNASAKSVYYYCEYFLLLFLDGSFCFNVCFGIVNMSTSLEYFRSFFKNLE